VLTVWDACQGITSALDLAVRLRVYAYDAYFLECAMGLQLPLLTLERGMAHVARQLNVDVLGERS
jgi:predicted nucleic acid-binding protein